MSYRKMWVMAIYLLICVSIIQLNLPLNGFLSKEVFAQAAHDHNKQTPTKKTVDTKKKDVNTNQEEVPTIEIPIDKQKLIGVKTTVASIKPIYKTIRTVGRIEYDERKLTTVNTKVEGWIERLYIDFTGRYVKKDEPIADIYSPELWATQMEFINLLRWSKRSWSNNERGEKKTDTKKDDGLSDLQAILAKDAESISNAARQRLKLWDISEDQIKRIEESEKPIRTLTVYSPISGYVLQKYAVQGIKVMPGERLLDIVDLSSLWVIADIYEYELPLIKVGEPATIQLTYVPGKQFTSRIDYIYPIIQGDTRTAKIRLVIPNSDGALKPQMFTNVEIKLNLGKRLVVPEDAVIDTGLRQIAYVDKGDGNFEPREIRVGIRADNLVEVTHGLKAGDKIASSANFLIDAEAKLKGVNPLPLKVQPKASGSK